MIVCETYFMKEDPDCADFLGGIDVYCRVPYGAQIADHRLTLGKSKITGEYVVWRHYSRWVDPFLREKNEIVFHSAVLRDALRFCNIEQKRFWEDVDDAFSEEPCDHGAHKAVFCAYKVGDVS